MSALLNILFLSPSLVRVGRHLPLVKGGAGSNLHAGCPLDYNVTAMLVVHELNIDKHVRIINVTQ